MPKISLIIPVYNVERYLRECLDSAVGQTLEDIEIIVVNDASPDNSRQIIAEYAARDARVVVLAHEHNQGSSAARNTGLERSRGEYIMFLDSDDTLARNSCELLYRKICEHQADIVECAFQNTDEQGKKLLTHRKCAGKENVVNDRQALQRYFMGRICTSTCNKIYKAELWHKNHLRFQTGLLMEDDYIIVDILALCHRFVQINTPLYRHRQHSASIMNSPVTEKVIDGYLMALGHQKEFIASSDKYQDLQELCRTKILSVLHRRCLYQDGRANIDPTLLQYWLESAPKYNLQTESYEVIASILNDFLHNAYSGKTIAKLLSQKMGIYPIYNYIKKLLRKSPEHKFLD